MVKISSDFTPRIVIVLLVLALLSFFSIAASPATAQPVPSPEKPWSDGPVRGEDFKQKPPEKRTPPKPRPIKDGVALKAEITTFIAVDFPATNSTAKADPTTKKIIVTTTSEAPKASAIMDKSKSWVDPTLKNDKKLLDHEQGHMDVTEKQARLLQEKFNKMKADGDLTVTKELPAGTSIDDIKKEMKRQKQEIDKNIDAKTNEQKVQSEKENDQYDKDTKHGEDPAGQKKARDAQRKALQDPNKEKKKKKGPDAESRSDKSIHFDATSGQLTIDNDFIVGIDPNGSGFAVSASDPILGSEVVIPAFSLIGQQDDGLFFFSGVGTAPRLEIRDGATALFTTALDHLLYDPSLNLFFGLGRDFDASAGSAFIDRLVADFSSGPPALFGIEFHPDVNFNDLTAGFTLSGASAFTNALGARIIATPEPGSRALFAVGLLMAIWPRRRRHASLSVPRAVSPRGAGAGSRPARALPS